MDIIKVSATSRTSAVAGAIAGVIREHNKAEVQAIGAGAVNQAVKAMILANGYLKEDGIHIACIPEFVDVEIDEKVRTAIRLVIEPMMVNPDEHMVEKEEPVVEDMEEPMELNTQVTSINQREPSDKLEEFPPTPEEPMEDSTEEPTEEPPTAMV